MAETTSATPFGILASSSTPKAGYCVCVTGCCKKTGGEWTIKHGEGPP